MANGPGETTSDSNQSKDRYVMTRFDYARSSDCSANLSARRAVLRTLKQDVTVPAGGTVTVTFEYGG